MQAHLLATLRELRDRGSVTAVARALHLSPSAVSQQLATLQRSAPVPLTRRDGRRLSLTDAGHRLVDAGQDVFTALARCDEVLRGLGDAARTPVHVAAFTSAAQTFFGGLLDDPGLDVRLHDHDVPTADFLALTGDVDIVIAHRAPHDRGWPAGAVTVEPLLTEPVDVALRAGHPAAGELTPAALARLRWVAVHADYPLAACTGALSAFVGSPVDVVHRLNDFQTVAGVLARTDCAGLLPRFTFVRPPQVERQAVPGLRLERHVDALVRTDRLERAGVQATLRRLHAVAAEVGAAADHH